MYSQVESKETPPSKTPPQSGAASSGSSGTPGKKKRQDFKFGKILGEGSYSTVRTK